MGYGKEACAYGLGCLIPVLTGFRRQPTDCVHAHAVNMINLESAGTTDRFARASKYEYVELVAEILIIDWLVGICLTALFDNEGH